ncbi:hypothetical protein TrLO_g12267 [Triparma laevis f. longispina]|uniref:Uncharacterized protein n=1 Tax=Triparma laevis f. longispina TaxID=1714387 RepID=A0A9W7FFZ4_9STRA|nr:hypothetical protein TrLO_g12267 [Triparma laevis f. longispina]
MSCSFTTCLTALKTADTSSLVCGAAAEQLSDLAIQISDSSSGSAMNDCDTAADWDNSAVSCAADVLAAIETLCKGKNECEFKATELLSDSSCGASYDSIDITSSCNDPTGIDTVTILSLLLICFIALSLGCTLTLDQFSEIWKNKKRAFLVGFASQFGFMPLFAWATAQWFGFSDLVATGVVLIGCAPGGSTSNLFTHWSKGNVALSIAMSSASTLAALFMMPLLIVIYIQTTFTKDSNVDIPFANIVITLLSIILPVVIGIAIRRKDATLSCCGDRKLHDIIEKVGGAFGALFLVAALVAGIRDNADLMDVQKYKNQWILSAMFEPMGCLFGFFVAKLTKLPPRDCRAVCLETGVQSQALIMALVALSWDGCERTEVLTFVVISTVWYVISSTWLVCFLRYVVAPWDGDEDEDEDAAKGAEGDKMTNVSAGAGEEMHLDNEL